MKKFVLFSLMLFALNQVKAQKVGLVLSGGGAKGLTHIGVLKALEEAGKLVIAGDWSKGWKDMVVQMPGGSNVINETEA